MLNPNIYSQNNPIKTSLIIPCHYTHAELLYSLLKCYEQQTELPDEVIISISEIHKIPWNVIDQLKQEKWIFPVKFLVSTVRLFAGENRNKACQNATGDIFISQDADDIPHPQRIEIIKHFFKHYNVDHFSHNYTLLSNGQTIPFFETYKDVGTVPFMYPRNFKDAHAKIMNGSVAISRRVFNKIHWSNKPSNQDTEFNAKVYNSFKNCMVVKVPLIGYRRYFSTKKYREA